MKMRGVVTIFGDSLNFNFTYADCFWIAFPFIMFFASLVCVFAGKWKAAVVITILIDLFNAVIMCDDGDKSFFITVFLVLAYSMWVWAIAYSKLKREKQLQKQQQLSIFQYADNQQTSDDERDEGE
jgi:hypothetical protein